MDRIWHGLASVARRAGPALLVAPLALAFLAGAPSAAAAGVCVNPHGTNGCLSSINAAIAAATPGATITIHAGSYVENVVVNKPVALVGDGDVTIYSAVSNPNCGGAGGPTLCAPESTIVLVQADNVTIDGLTIDGDNPHLHSGVIVGGADIDARNGIVTDFNTVNTVQNLVVRNTTVRNVFRRGIQITSNSGSGSFTFRDDVVRNVQGDPNTSVAVISNGEGNTGLMQDITVSDSSDALNSNWSHGITFRDNTVTRSGSGIHTDNAGGAGSGTPDLIVDNTITNCQPNGYGIFTFASYVPPTVRDNSVSNCATGLAVYGTSTTATPVFKGNTVRGNGGAGTIGALVTTDLTVFGFGYFNVSASFSGNVIRGAAIGEQVVQSPGYTANATFTGETVTKSVTGLDANAATVSFNNGCLTQNGTGLLARNGATLTAHGDQITHNSSYGANNSNAGGAPAVDASKNWWGSASGPAPTGHGDLISAGVNATPFLTYSPQNCGDA